MKFLYIIFLQFSDFFLGQKSGVFVWGEGRALVERVDVFGVVLFPHYRAPLALRRFLLSRG